MEYEEKEIYLFLDFKGVLPPTTFKRNKMFFKMINLDSDTPLVQLDDVLYKGKYSDTIGTNVFFEEVEEDGREALDKPTPIRLKHLLNQTKLLEMERVKLPDNMLPTDENNCVKVKFDCDYKLVLDKISNGSFRIEDYVVENVHSESEDEESATVENKIISIHSNDDTPKQINLASQANEITRSPAQNKPTEASNATITDSSVVKHKEIEQIYIKEEESSYNQSLNALRRAAQEPLHIQQKHEMIQISPDLKFNVNLLPYAAIDLLLQNMSLEEITLKTNMDSFYGFFDSKSIIKHGALKPFHKISEINELLNINNFENLGIIGKLCVLMQYLRAEEQHLKEMPKEELLKVDSFGYTLLQRHELLKLFATKTVHVISKKIKTHYLRKM
ncbi:uncharacterized protein LOC108741156 [Agrilus planipennis]|uniref:Uncharacterized protein LOC108741156 n=1 Tax=Agrilus planipennis TaxID=224129 RepID=A0A1W4XF09_AGRPL|nr:uncharacterized protein LOC108741156 [Agrilus planipennis]